MIQVHVALSRWVHIRQLPLYAADRLGPPDIEVVYGFFAGAITTLTVPIDVAMAPTRVGMLLIYWSLGVLVSIPIAGRVREQLDRSRGLLWHPSRGDNGFRGCYTYRKVWSGKSAMLERWKRLIP
nr:hypothetical protein CFP56_04157 [Quercus suber]